METNQPNGLSDSGPQESSEEKGDSTVIENIDSWKIKNYYQVLGVTNKATPEEIKKSYRKLVTKYHPDKVASSGLEAVKKNYEEIIKIINQANDVISDSRLRVAYDEKILAKEQAGFSSSTQEATFEGSSGSVQFNQEIYERMLKDIDALFENRQSFPGRYERKVRPVFQQYESMVNAKKKEASIIADDDIKKFELNVTTKNGAKRVSLMKEQITNKLKSSYLFGAFKRYEQQKNMVNLSKEYAKIQIENGILIATDAYVQPPMSFSGAIDGKMDNYVYGKDSNADAEASYYKILDPDSGKELTSAAYKKIEFSKKGKDDKEIELIIGHQPYKVKNENLITQSNNSNYSYGILNNNISRILGYKENGKLYFLLEDVSPY
ncbi:MAG: DnaJ domain-containing protein [bacterium]